MTGIPILHKRPADVLQRTPPALEPNDKTKRIQLSIIMNHNTPESTVINLSSVTLENMKTELNDKIYVMIELAWEALTMWNR